MMLTRNQNRTQRRRSGNHATPIDFRVESVLVAIGNRAQAELVLNVGRTLAKADNATLHVIPIGLGAGSQAEMARELQVGTERLDGCVFHFAEGDPVEPILRRVTELPGALLVLPAQLGAAAPRDNLGPMVKEVLLKATAPVVLMPPKVREHEWQLNRILLPHDGTPTTAAAVQPAMHLARQCGAEVVALHVAASGRSQPPEPGTLTTPYYADQPQYEWPAWGKEFLERIRVLGPESEKVKLQLLLATGKPASEIVTAALARNIDLTVLAWRGAWRAERASVIKRVVRESCCPVLVIRVSQ